MYGRLQEEVAWTSLLDRQREAENRRLQGEFDGPPGVPVGQRLGDLVARLARLAVRLPVDGVRAVRERREAVRDVA